MHLMSRNYWMLVLFIVTTFLLLLNAQDENEVEGNDFLVPIKSDPTERIVVWESLVKKYAVAKITLKEYKYISQNPMYGPSGVMVSPYETMVKKDEHNTKHKIDPQTASWFNNYAGSVVPEIFLVICVPLAIYRCVRMLWRVWRPYFRRYYERDIPYFHINLAEIQHSTREKKVRYEPRRKLNWLARHFKIQLDEDPSILDYSELFPLGLDNDEFFATHKKNPYTVRTSKWNVIHPIQTMTEIYEVAKALEKQKIDQIDPRVRERWHRMEKKKKNPGYRRKPFPPLPSLKDRLDFHMFDERANNLWRWRRRNLNYHPPDEYLK